jgi:hypothetical protein
MRGCRPPRVQNHLLIAALLAYVSILQGRVAGVREREEHPDQPRRLLDAAKARLDTGLQVGLRADKRPANFVMLHVIPDLFVRIHLRGVRRQKEEPQAAIARRRVLADEPRLVDGVAVQHQEDRSGDALHRPANAFACNPVQPAAL